jgi:hypothetical protein
VTSPRKRVAAVRTLTRDQIVAALLVGSVVILLGFASGLGIEPATVSQSAATPTVSTDGGAGSDVGEAPNATPIAAPPVAYVINPAPVLEPTVPAATTSATTVAPAGTPLPPPSTTDISSSVASTPTCTPGVLTELLNALLPSSSGTGLLGFGALLNSLVNVTSGLSTLLSLNPAQLLDRVTTTLDLGELAAPCTADVAEALPLLAGGTTISTAVAAVEADPK